MIDSKEVASLQKLIALSDDEPAYVRLYRIYFTPLLYFACSFVRSKQVAEEIVSDVMLQVWRHRQRLDTIENLTVYLYTCIRNHSLNYLEKQQRTVTWLYDEASLQLPGTAADPEQLFITTELMREMDMAVQQLPPKCRLIFKLIREDGLKYKEVAAVLNISVKTVEAQIGIAMKKLSEAIQPHTGEKNRLNVRITR